MENTNTVIYPSYSGHDITDYTDKLFSIMLKFCPTSYNSAEGAIKKTVHEELICLQVIFILKYPLYHMLEREIWIKKIGCNMSVIWLLSNSKHVTSNMSLT